MLIDPDTRRVEVYRPNPDRSCLYVDQSEQGELVLESIGFRLPLDGLFKGMDRADSA